MPAMSQMCLKAQGLFKLLITLIDDSVQSRLVLITHRPLVPDKFE